MSQSLKRDQYFYGADASSTLCAESQSNLLALQKGECILAMTLKHGNSKDLTIACAGRKNVIYVRIQREEI